MIMAFKYIYIIVMLALLCASNVFSIIYEECEDEEFNAYVRSSESCQSYLICRGENSAKLSCEAGEYFDMETQSCDLEENVFCPLDEEEVDEGDDDDDEEENEADENGDADYVDEEDDGTGDENAESGNEIENTNIDRRNTTSNETTTFNPIVITPIVKDVCPNVDNANEIVMMQNNQSCSDYYLCYHGQAIQMHCTDSFHFNKRTGKCDYPEKAQCSLDRPNTLKCFPNTTTLFPHPERCNYFYYCIKGLLTIQHCPHHLGWDIEKQACAPMSEAKCHKTARKT